MQYKEVPGNHLWVSGLSSRCKAADLKKFFARYANVGSAKIVANARTTSAHCYGYITVESPADLEKCVQKLHSTRFEGSLIRVEICKLAPADQLRKVEMKNRERLAQQKEEFRKRKEERKRKIDEEMKRREELERRKELEKRREEDRKKHEGKRREDDVKKEHKKDDRKPPERRRTRSRSPFDRRRPQPFRRQELIRRPGGPPPPRRFNSPPGHRRGSPPYVRNRPRRMSPPSPFGRAPPAPFVHGPPVVERMPGIDRGRMIERDRRIDDERFEVERRQRAEADALERERRQLRMEEERLEREKLDLIRLERERVKKEMEEVAARKDLAERRRQEELRRQQEEERKREELRLEMERRAPREPPRPPMPPTAAGPIELYDPRLPLPVEDYSRAQAEDKFAGRLGPPLQRDQAAPRHDDRRRDDRRREPPIMSRDDRRPPESLDPWNASDLKSRGSGDYLDQRARHDTQLVQPPKRMRSRSPQRTGVTNSGYGVLSAADYGMSRGPSASDSWPPQGSRGPMSSMPSTSFLDSRRAPPPPVATRTPEVPPSGGSQWSSNAARVAFPPSYGHQESSRGLLGSTSVPSIGSFGLGALPTSGFRRY
ncbi:SAFB transcription modulator [Tropilaelaps mercedesae]|uniref:SAFB transcription modulator n=1 Tax=Tropilaelaps mercedesae TaxID=418985 RepID=A0A1V9XT47_9ACAR|nr:SAFB transcription modulator [Tropilaelaps mercedesae]